MSSNLKIEDLLDTYCGLEEHEREAVGVYVRNHPEWEPHLALARRWRTMLSEARSLADPESDTESVAHAASSAYLAGAAVPESLTVAMERLNRRIEADDSLRARFHEFLGRIDELESTSDTIAHFEAVSGHRVRERAVPYGANRSRSSPAVTRAHRAPIRIVGRGLVQSAALALGVYFVLFTVSISKDSRLERMSYLRSYDLSWTELGVSTRGNDPEWVEAMTRRYEAAILEADVSRSSFLGLFPSYDLSRLRLARSLLIETIRIQNRLEPAPPAAHLMLAKIHLLLGDESEAASELKAAQRDASRASVQAKEMLELF